jgi:hypothetical protein
MQQRPSKLPYKLKDGTVNPAQWHSTSQNTSTTPFHNLEAQSGLRNTPNKFRKTKQASKAPLGTNRRAYLFVPQVHQDLEASKVTYRIAELLLSESEIAAALSYWNAHISGVRNFTPRSLHNDKLFSKLSPSGASSFQVDSLSKKFSTPILAPSRPHARF